MNPYPNFAPALPPNTTPPGWYPDPSGAPGHAYWTGTEWDNLPQKKSHKKLLLGGLGAFAALIVLAGIGAATDNKPTPTTAASASTTSVVAPVSDAQRLYEWRMSAQPVISALSTDMTNLGSAATNMDLPELRSTCRTLEGDLDALDGHLPTPNAGVTTELRGAVDDYRQMTFICRTLGPYTSVDEVNQMTALINSGTTHVVAATKLINGPVSTASGAG